MLTAYRYSINIRLIISSDDQIGADITLAPETVKKNGASSLRESVFDFFINIRNMAVSPFRIKADRLFCFSGQQSHGVLFLRVIHEFPQVLLSVGR